jgi:hypothetical protein
MCLVCNRKNYRGDYFINKGNNKITVLPILFLYLKILKSDSTHHFFRNVCTKSGSLRFSQFSGCWLILQKNSWHFWLLYHYTFSLYENASLIIFSAETEYISTRYWYRNINFLRDRIRRIFLWCLHLAIDSLCKGQ